MGMNDIRFLRRCMWVVLAASLLSLAAHITESGDVTFAEFVTAQAKATVSARALRLD